MRTRRGLRALVLAVVVAGAACAAPAAPPAPPGGAGAAEADAAEGAAVAAAVAPATDTWFVLVNRHSGKALDDYEHSLADGADVVQWARNDGAWQQWRFVSSGDGWYRLVNRHSGKALDVLGWSRADGGDVVQWADLGGANQQWRLDDAGDGHVTAVNRHSGKALEVYEWSRADGGDVVQWAPTGAANQQWRLVPIGPVGGGATPEGVTGWATQGGGTTGGGSAAPTTVTTASALSAALGRSGPGVIRVSGTISCSGMLRVTSDKSVLGAPGATIAGCGLNIRQARNVVVRNLTFRGWDDDAVNVEESQRVWVDHNTFTDGYDGAVDIKRASDFVTVSWNRVHGHDKAMLLGHSDDNGAQDRGHLRVTYHHNWFDGSGTRHPRVRFGNPVHVYNNLYVGNEYGVASTMGAGVLVEGNHFEDVEEPTLVGYADSAPGTLVQRGNAFVRSGAPQAAGTVASLPYAYRLDPTSSVPTAVRAGAGAGRITP
jgi:pectate lyase